MIFFCLLNNLMLQLLVLIVLLINFVESFHKWLSRSPEEGKKHRCLRNLLVFPFYLFFHFFFFFLFFSCLLVLWTCVIYGRGCWYTDTCYFSMTSSQQILLLQGPCLWLNKYYFLSHCLYQLLSGYSPFAASSLFYLLLHILGPLQAIFECPINNFWSQITTNAIIFHWSYLATPSISFPAYWP